MKTGDELLALVKQHKDAPAAKMIRAAGYVCTTPAGRERLQRMAFYKALVVAKGLLPPGSGRKAGRKLSYSSTALSSGALQIGQRYAEQIGLKAGDAFQIEIRRGTIAVVPLQSATKA